MKIDIINLYSNIAPSRSELQGDHGQSFLIQFEDQKILFDTGAKGDILLHNMKHLNIDPNSITQLILSHGHYDHTAGLPAFLDARDPSLPPLPVLAHPAVHEQKRAKILFIKKDIGFPTLTSEQSAKLAYTYEAKPVEITPFLRTTGEIRDRPYRDGIEPTAQHKEDDIFVPDPMWDDISLILSTTSGQVIITGCAHAGALNIMHYTKSNSAEPIHAIIGGSHMVRYTPDEIGKTAALFKTEFGEPELYLNHCTDKLPSKLLPQTKTLEILPTVYDPSKVHACLVGTKLTFEVG